MLALGGEDWRADLYRTDSPLHLLRPISLELTFKYCLITTDPEYPITQLAGRLPCLGLAVEERRLLMLAEILETILDPDEEDQRVARPSAATTNAALRRSDSNSSFSSAVSSLTGSTTGGGSSYIGWKRNRAVPDGAVPDLPRGSTTAATTASAAALNVVQLDMSFTVDKLVLEIERDAVPIFNFQILDTGANIRLKASGTVRGGFAVGACRCEHLRFKTPTGSPVLLLCTTAAASAESSSSQQQESSVPVPTSGFYRIRYALAPADPEHHFYNNQNLCSGLYFLPEGYVETYRYR
jgi:Repeating coiled region of VPS13